MPLLEVCVDNIDSVYNAYNGGADRIELCSALSEGGLTPSLGFLQAARRATSPRFPIFVMIRPRGGNFVYSNDEIEIMKCDIVNLKDGGADGFVFGVLTTENMIDEGKCKQLLEVVGQMAVTFHRAFDEVKSPEKQLQALDTIMELGFTRLLTSGGACDAPTGALMISLLRAHSQGRMVVMPGGGLTTANIKPLLLTCQATEFHGSAKGVSPTDYSITSKAVVQQFKAIAATVERNLQV